MKSTGVEGLSSTGLAKIVGESVRLVTVDGLVRSGILTKVETRVVRVDGREVHFPTVVVLNGDDSDPIPFSVLESVEQYE